MDIIRLIAERKALQSENEALKATIKELTLDLEAVLRVSGLLKKKESAEDESPGPDKSIRETISEILNADPEARWTAQQILSRLRSMGYPLRAKQPIYSVCQALAKMAELGRIRLVRRGTGNAPHIYKGAREAQK